MNVSCRWIGRGVTGNNLHFKVIMFFGTYGAWWKESAVPVVNWVRLPETFSCSLNYVFHDEEEEEGMFHCGAEVKVNGAGSGSVF